MFPVSKHLFSIVIPNQKHFSLFFLNRSTDFHFFAKSKQLFFIDFQCYPGIVCGRVGAFWSRLYIWAFHLQGEHDHAKTM